MFSFSAELCLEFHTQHRPATSFALSVVCAAPCEVSAIFKTAIWMDFCAVIMAFDALRNSKNYTCVLVVGCVA